MAVPIIGLAYNQKPEPSELVGPVSSGDRHEDGELSRPDEEPPSKKLDPSIADLIARDQFAEWDSPVTIAAVESALSPLGKSSASRQTRIFRSGCGRQNPTSSSTLPRAFTE